MTHDGRPLALDLFCGLGGWTEGLLAEGYEVIGFDIERHQYGEEKYPAQLVLQDILTIHGSQFRNVDLIVASPPCQTYSWMAMPFSRGKQKAAWYREDPARQVELNALFNACFRIQREASKAAGREIPMVVENVKGAQPWVGPARAHFGSFYLWGNVESVGGAISGTVPKFGELLRAKRRGSKNNGGLWFAIGSPGQSSTGRNPDGRKVPGINFHEFERTGEPGRSFQSAAVDGLKTVGHANIRDGHSHTRHLTNQRESDSVKQPGLSGEAWFNEGAAAFSSSGLNRKAASAQIAKIPFALSQYIARVFKPEKCVIVESPSKTSTTTEQQEIKKATAAKR